MLELFIQCWGYFFKFGFRLVKEVLISWVQFVVRCFGSLGKVGLEEGQSRGWGQIFEESIGVFQDQMRKCKCLSKGVVVGFKRSVYDRYLEDKVEEINDCMF